MQDEDAWIPDDVCLQHELTMLAVAELTLPFLDVCHDNESFGITKVRHSLSIHTGKQYSFIFGCSMYQVAQIINAAASIIGDRVQTNNQDLTGCIGLVYERFSGSFSPTPISC
jgi:hypothetical protein